MTSIASRIGQYAKRLVSGWASCCSRWTRPWSAWWKRRAAWTFRWASAALIDSDDVRLGLAAANRGSADVFFLLGVADNEALRWIGDQVERAPVAIFVKEPSDALVATAVAAGSAVVAVEPRARWERLYQLVNHVLEHHGDRADPHGGRRAPTCSVWRSRWPTASTAWSASKTPSRTCWPIRPPTTKPTSCVGCPSWAAPARPSIWSGSANGESSTRCVPAARWCASPSARSWACARGWRSGFTSLPPAPRAAGVRRHDLGAAGFAAAGRRRRRDVAGRGGAGRPDHVAAGGSAVHACAAGAATAGADRRGRRRHDRHDLTPANSACPPTVTPR